MKLPFAPSLTRPALRWRWLNRRPAQCRGSAIIIVMATLGIAALIALANIRMLYHLKNEVRLIEQRQVKRWSTVATNQPPAAPAIVSTNSPALQP